MARAALDCLHSAARAVWPVLLLLPQLLLLPLLLPSLLLLLLRSMPTPCQRATSRQVENTCCSSTICMYGMWARRMPSGSSRDG